MVTLSPVLEVNPYVDVDLFTDLDHAVESRTITPALNLVFMNGGSLAFEYERRAGV